MKKSFYTIGGKEYKYIFHPLKFFLIYHYYYILPILQITRNRSFHALSMLLLVSLRKITTYLAFVRFNLLEFFSI